MVMADHDDRCYMLSTAPSTPVMTRAPPFLQTERCRQNQKLHAASLLIASNDIRFPETNMWSHLKMEGRNTFHFWWHFFGCYVKFDGGHYGHCTNVWRRFVRKGLADFAWKSNGGPFSQTGSSEEQVVGNCLSQPPTKSMNSVFSTMQVPYFWLKSLQFDFLFGCYDVHFFVPTSLQFPSEFPSDIRRRISVFGHAERHKVPAWRDAAWRAARSVSWDLRLTPDKNSATWVFHRICCGWYGYWSLL